MRNNSRLRGFTLIELLICLLIGGILVAVLFSGFNTAMDHAKHAKCVANLRAIAAGTLSYASERNGRIWTRAEIGYSAFRMYEDPIGVPQLLKDYVPNSNVWICPAGRSTLKIFGNNYSWSTASAYDTKPIIVAETLWRTLLFNDAYQYSLPSMYNAAEPTNGGPPGVGKKDYWYFPHANRKKINWAFADGHVISGESAAQ